MYLLPKVHQLTTEEITQAETHSFKSPDKTLSGRPVIAQNGSPTYYLGKIIDVSPHRQKKHNNNRTRMWDTPHFIRLIESHQVSCDCTLIAYDCTPIYTNMELNELIKAVAEALPREVRCSVLEKTILQTNMVQLLKILLTSYYCTFHNNNNNVLFLCHFSFGAQGP